MIAGSKPMGRLIGKCRLCAGAVL